MVEAALDSATDSAVTVLNGRLSSCHGAREGVFDTISGFIWGWPAWPMPVLAMLLLGTGIFLTLRLRFINVRGFSHAIRIVRGDYDDPDDPGDISHFQALTTALSATVAWETSPA
jgi:Na+/alanine symporter